MNVCLVLVTHNRLEYTRKCLQRLLVDDQTSDFELYIWDNASTDETRDYLRNSISDPRIKKLIFYDDNVGPTMALNRVWADTKAELVGKVDNDCLVSAGWTRILAEAHCDIKHLGAVACWHYLPHEFRLEIAGQKIQSFGRHSIFRHPWVCGTGFLLKRKTFLEIGRCPEGDRRYGLTDYFLKIAMANYVNGWYYPLVYQEHMDDPLSEHCMYRDDASMQVVKDVTYTMRTHGIDRYSRRLRRRSGELDVFHYGPINPKYYIGWKVKLIRRVHRRLDITFWKSLYRVRRLLQSNTSFLSLQEQPNWGHK